MPIWNPASSSGGGGVSFVFDGAVFDIGDRVQNEDGADYYPVTLTLTLADEEIEEAVHAVLFLARSDGGTLKSGAFAITGDDTIPLADPAGGTTARFYILIYPEEPTEISVEKGVSSVEEVYIKIMLPDGSIITSAALDFSEAPPPP